VLDQIGYRATARIVGSSGSSSYYDAVGAARTGAQIGWAGWIKDYISPEDFVVPLFACSGISTPASTTNDSRFCDPVLERQIAHAESVQQVDTVAGQAAWGAADRRIVDAAAAVPYANDLTLTLLSNRTRNYQFNPEWGVLLDQLWVR
jgi:ABC-type oligopeptide transport system substrate-binding subunit